MLKIVIGTNEGKVLCISNNEDEIKASMVNYLIDTDQEPTEDFFESRNWGEYDIEVYEYHQPQLNENQQVVLDGLKFIFVNYNQEFGTDDNIKYALRDFYWYLGTDYSISENKKIVSMCESYDLLSADEFAQVLELFSKWAQEQEKE